MKGVSTGGHPKNTPGMWQPLLTQHWVSLLSSGKWGYQWDMGIPMGGWGCSGRMGTLVG